MPRDWAAQRAGPLKFPVLAVPLAGFLMMF
jgi:hypothetical protein